MSPIKKNIYEYDELNNNMIISRYNQITNIHSDFLWKIKSTLIMKRIYPILCGDDYLQTNGFIELYRFGTQHYEKQLRINAIR
tara:strand:- start:4553 stop:4801 length:249 start_codon:yes stop_codon:yes gene_type:complete